MKHELETGWSLNHYNCNPCHVELITQNKADARKRRKDEVHVVETVNWSLAENGGVHLKKYFTFSLREAIGLAVQIEMDADEVAEEVVGIRPATRAEDAAFYVEWERLHAAGPQAEAAPQGNQLN